MFTSPRCLFLTSLFNLLPCWQKDSHICRVSFLSRGVVKKSKPVPHLLSARLENWENQYKNLFLDLLRQNKKKKFTQRKGSDSWFLYDPFIYQFVRLCCLAFFFFFCLSNITFVFWWVKIYDWQTFKLKKSLLFKIIFEI